MINFSEKAALIWSVADLLRGDFKQSEFGRVVLPFTVLRWFDCVLAPWNKRILEKDKTLKVANKMPIFKRMTGHDYYNTSRFDFASLLNDSNAIDTNLRDYIGGFSDNVKDILDHFDIGNVIEKLKKANLLYKIVQRFGEMDLGSDTVDDLTMGYMFEELIRRFSEQSNDPACGTGGMLSVAQDAMRKLNASLVVIPFGQELNPETYAIYSDEHRRAIVKLYSQYEPSEYYLDCNNTDFGFHKITVERPLRDEHGNPVTDKKGNIKPDAALRDTETVPLQENIRDYFKREVLPHVPDAWLDESKTRIGYEIPLTRYFYQFTPLRASSDILAEIKSLETQVAARLKEVTK